MDRGQHLGGQRRTAGGLGRIDLLAADARRGVIRSTNRGETWTQACGSGQLKGSKLIELPDGRLAGVANKSIKVSTDHGATWAAVLDATPVQPAGVIYAPARQAFFIWNWDCGNKVLTNAVWRQDYRIESKPPR